MWDEFNAHYIDNDKEVGYQNGEKYEHAFKNGLKEGRGTYYSYGDKYEGEFKNGIKEGNGTYYYADGRKYVGEFKNDGFNGNGTFYALDGSIWFRGQWEDDERIQP